MPTKLFLGFTTALYLLGFSIAQAQVVINEFVADPDSGSEWIELANTSGAEVNLNGYKWTELSSPGEESEHEGTAKNLSGTISAGGFFVIEINSALNNTGDSIGLYNGSSLIDRVSFGNIAGYQKNIDAPAKGKSGALIAEVWQTNQEPTKGQANQVASSNNDNDDSSSSTSTSTSSTSSTQTTAIVSSVSQKIRAEVSARNIAYVGIPHSFSGKVMQGNQQIYRGKYFWNFGDGDFREVKVINTDKFTHTFFYPGDYNVIFEYYPDSFAEESEVAQKIAIKAIEPQISISRVGDTNDFFVELLNHTTYDVDVSSWVLSSNGRSFTIPKNTIIVASKKIIISGRTSGFTISDLPVLKLATPTGEVVFEYSPYISGKTSMSKSSASRATTVSGTAEEDKIAKEDLSAALAYAENSNERGLFSNWIWPVIFLILVGGAAYGVYYIRRKPTPALSGQEFEIMDE